LAENRETQGNNFPQNQAAPRAFSVQTRSVDDAGLSWQAFAWADAPFTPGIDIMTPDPYFFIIIFVGVALIFPLLPLALAWLWRRFFQPPKPGAEKNAIYECGIESIGEAQVQFRSQYYLYCIIFLIFDVEAIFLVPFAVAFTGLPVGAFIAILVFLLLLIEGLVWAWSKGCLNWAK
jgi:NADH:ubiquinone oxidoreductase subunit 3 (subunit A)